MVDIIRSKPQAGNMIMVGNEGLFMFYLSQYMKENTFRIINKDAYAIVELEGDTLILHAIFGEMSVDEVIASFGRNIKKVILGFTPSDKTGYQENPVKIEDTTLFVKGRAFETLGNYRFMLQPITHA